jgi:alpha-L-fucosidase 2
MKSWVITILTRLLISVFVIFPNMQDAFCQTEPASMLWYDKPATIWEEALPVGNGRLGAMYFGNVYSDRLQFNEDTYWSGGPYSTVVKGGYKMLPAIQRLLFEGRHVEAHLMFGRYLLGNPVEQQKYQSMGNVVMNFTDTTSFSGYRRELDLLTGITSISYNQGGVNYRREVFASYPDQTIIMRISADKPASVSFSCQLQGVRNQTHSNYATDYFQMDIADDDLLSLAGKSADYLGVEGKLRYDARLRIYTKGGKKSRGIKLLNIENADEVYLVLVAATNFNSYKDVSGNSAERAENYLEKINGRDFADIRNDHINDYGRLYGRVKLELPVTKNSYLPTDERIKMIQSEPDPSLAALCYQFGRYLMISSSRPGTQPANLQGIWNNDQNPMWDSKYTTNINTEMNYWNVDAGNLSECAMPLFDLIRGVSDQGREVAREHYGIENGWVFHQNTDLWRVAAPMDGSNWGGFTVGGAWLCTHIWEHYLYTSDRKFLEENYQLIKGSAEFFLGFLTEDPATGYLVTNPSTSPENTPANRNNFGFFDEMNGAYYKGSQLCYGSTIDNQILTDLFAYVVAAASELGIDQEFRERVLATRDRLVPMMVGGNGMLQEWISDIEGTEKDHRHFSHLYGLYPGNVISPVKTPELTDPVRKVLEQRGDESTGFSRAWKMCTWARLYDGNRANKIFKGYLKDQCFASLFAKCGKAFQVDGSFGVSAAVSEMLVQSHESFIQLLPALPDEWSPSGSFGGVVARGAFELSFSWVNGRVVSAKMISRAGNNCRIKCNTKPRVESEGQNIRVEVVKDGIYSFKTIAGKSYSLRF